MSVIIKQFKSEWIGYIRLDNINVFAHIGTFDDVNNAIKDKINGMWGL